MPELARSRADGVIDRSKTRGIPLDPSAAEGRSSDWNLCRGNHLGQRSCASATTGRTYGRKRSDQSTAQHPGEERAVHIWIKAIRSRGFLPLEERRSSRSTGWGQKGD